MVWWNLVPDTHHEIVVSGYGGFDDVNYVAAAFTPGGGCAVAYFPCEAKVAINPERLKNGYKASWIDPANGDQSPAAGSANSNGLEEYRSPGLNSAGEPDWALMLR
jgi:hypothetical protein